MNGTQIVLLSPSGSVWITNAPGRPEIVDDQPASTTSQIWSDVPGVRNVAKLSVPPLVELATSVSRIVPVVVALSRKVSGEREDIMLGFGAHLDPALALRRALAEMNQMMPAVVDGLRWDDDPDLQRWLTTATVAKIVRHGTGRRGGPVG